MGKLKTWMNLAVVGHVDCGKSTLIGNLVYKCGGIDKRTIEKFEKEAAEMGQSSFKYAWVMDKLQLERKRGLTIECHRSKFETSKFNFAVIDCPGHKDFENNKIAGVSMADAALLVVDATKGGFEAGMSNGRDTGQGGGTHDDALICYAMGVKQLIVVINKIDDQSVNQSTKRYKEIEEQVRELLKKIGFRDDRFITFVHVSAWEGVNLTERQGNADLCLVEALDRLIPPKRPSDKPLRFALHKVFKVGGIGTVCEGIVVSGVLMPEDQIHFALSDKNSEVKKIEKFYTAVESAGPGDLVGLNVCGLSVKDLRLGDVVSHSKVSPALKAKSFTAQVIILQHPNQLRNGYAPIIHIGSQKAACRWTLKEKIDKRTNKTVQDATKTPKADPNFLKFLEAGDGGIVEMEPIDPLCVEAFKDFSKLGRFVITDSRKIVGMGVVKAVVHEEGAK